MGNNVMSFYWRLKDRVKPFLRLNNYKNLYGWIKVVWDTHWWDYSYLLEIMQHQFELMDKGWYDGHYIGKERDHKRIKEMRVLLERMREDDYDCAPWRKEEYSNTNGIFKDLNGQKFTPIGLQDRRRKADDTRFGYLFGKHIRAFWD